MSAPHDSTAAGPTYLRVPYAEKDQAKALGARWDPAQRQWYAPAGLVLTPFAPWLPATSADPAPPTPTTATSASSTSLVRPGTALASAPDGGSGISLSQLLQGVAQVVAAGFDQSVWTRVEVLRVSSKNGHVYLELTERDDQERVLAKALGMLWANVAQRVLPQFEQATGAQLGPGIQLLVLARPVFKAQHGFSIDISAIDPAYTLGQLEAHKRQIRQRLQLEQVFERNRQLPPPWSYAHVLVVAPQDAAGLGDFAADAQRLERAGLCRFTYVHSRFQGEGAGAAILQALQEALAQHPPATLDAIAIIRGGGAVNDLAWLNDYALAHFICTCPLPVLTGIGHERDHTILDEVAHRSFDTPSKAIAAIQQHIVERVRQAQQHFQHIVSHARQQLQERQAQVQQLDAQLRQSAQQHLAQARQGSSARLADIRLAVQHHLHQAQQQVPAALAHIQTASQAHIRLARSQLAHLGADLRQQANRQQQLARQQLASTRATLLERAQRQLHTAHHNSQALVREITGQGPEKTLARGFALVRSPDGQPLTSAQAIRAHSQAHAPIVLHFADGPLPAQPLPGPAPPHTHTPDSAP